jgi:hypothetical protein
MANGIGSKVATLGMAAALASGMGTAGATCLLPQALNPTQAGVTAAAVQAPANWMGTATQAGHGDGGPAPGIEGLWKFMFSDTQGTVYDFGYIGMHEGGTETLNSFGRAPVTGDVCMGAWKRNGYNRYKVSHYAPIYDTDNVTFLGTVNIIEELKLSSDGARFTGTTQSTGYGTDGKVLFQAVGMATGTRVTADTPAP